MKVVNAEIKETMKANEVNSNKYINLPIASDKVQGVIKYDNNTLKLNNLGQLYADGSLNNNSDNSIAVEHIEDESKHLNNLRRKNLDEVLPSHVNNHNIHLTESNKNDLIESLDLLEEHLKLFHLSEDDYNSASKLIKETKITIENHINNTEIHGSSGTISSISRSLDELVKKVNELIGDYNVFKPTSENDIANLKDEKLNKYHHPGNKILCTNGDGDIYYVNASIFDLETLDNFNETIAKIREDINTINTNKADKTMIKNIQDIANDHYNNKSIHTSDEEKAAILDRINGLEEFNELNPPGGGGIELTKPPTAGNVAFYNSENEKIATPSFVLLKGVFVDTQKELEEAKGVTVSFEEVFNKWKRFSHDTTSNQPANESETKAWRYDAQGKRVVCTINSATHIGFISREKYDSYTHECTVKSNDGDNDMIGMIIAFTVDSDGKEHSLTLVRVASVEGHVQVAGAPAFQWGIVYNFGRSDAKLISTKVIEGDRNTPWSSIPNGIRLRVERGGNSIKAYTSKMNELNILNSSIIEADLSDPLLNKFAGEKSYGYSCFSQPSSTFEDIKFMGGNLDSIYDMRNGDKWVLINDNWVIDTLSTIQESLGYGKLLYNENTRKLFFLKDIDNITRIDLMLSQDKTRINNRKYGSSKERPINQKIYDEPYFDTDLNKALWWNGANWIDAIGNIV